MAKPEVLTNIVNFGDNPYLIGPHEPIREELDSPELECIGDIPKDFSGIYLRNGPNQDTHLMGCTIGLMAME